VTGWKLKKISEVCDLIVDCVNKTAPKVSYPTPYKMIRTPNIRDGRINLDDCRFVDEETYKKWTRRATVDEGDVLLTREAPMGEVGRVGFKDTVFLGQRIVQYRANAKELDSHFLLYSFRSAFLQAQFRKYDSSGSIVSHIPVPACTRFQIPTPPIPTQKKIAQVLSTLDAKIELNNRINRELEGLAKLLYDYWFVQFDFPISAEQAKAIGNPKLEGRPYRSSGGKMVYNQKLKREIPEEWSDGNILAVSDIGGGATPSKKNLEFWGGDVPFFTPTDATSEVFCLNTEDHLTSLGLKGKSTRLYPKGTLFITARGSVGNAMIISREMAMNQSCYALCPHAGVGSTFLYFHTMSLMDYLHAKSSGSVFDSIVTNDIDFTPAIVPLLEQISAFNRVADPMFESILSYQKQNHELAKLRDWLLPMLMNGQVTVGL
jgi:type I restriction enzyme, S subunit